MRDRDQYSEWVGTMTGEFERMRQGTESGLAMVLDKYGASNPAEFFAVATECFFEQSRSLQTRHPSLYAVLQDYYCQDPVVRG